MRSLTTRKFRKGEYIVEAVILQNDVKYITELIDFLGYIPEIVLTNELIPNTWIRKAGIKLRTPDGEVIVTEGDWIVKGTDGRFYPCKPDIFEQTYERVIENEI